MQLTLHIPSPNQYWNDIHRILGQRIVEKKHLPSEKIRVFNYFRRNIGGGKKFSCRKFQPRSITTLSMQLSKKQRHPANTFEEKERQN